MKKKKYRIWSLEQTKYLKEFWPHFGTYGIARIMPFLRKQIKTKVNKLKLVLLPKNKRLCFVCKMDYQFSRYAGIKCRKCHLELRKENKRNYKKSKKRWMQTLLNTLKYRNQNCNLTTNYIFNLWYRQNGRCFYSGIEMKSPKYGSKRIMSTASLDRIDCTKGYIKKNVVWCCWACNMGKGELTKTDYINLCNCVASFNKDNAN